MTESTKHIDIRDYFASQVISTCWVQSCVLNNTGKLDDKQTIPWAAALAYQLADALLAKRNQQTRQPLDKRQNQF